MEVPPDVFPAGQPGLTARFLTLRSRARVRIVEAGAPGGRPVVLLPGWACSAYLYRHTFRPLAEAGLHAIAVELRGQGWSDHPDVSGVYSLDAMAAQALEVLDALDLGAVRLVGMSLGGGVALRAALEAPSRVQRLALLGAVGLGRVHFVWMSRVLPTMFAPAFGRLFHRISVTAALRIAYGRLGAPTAHDVDEYHAPARNPAFGRALWRQLHEVDWRPLGPRELRRLSMPVLAVFGTHDYIVPPRDVGRMLAHVPDARLALVDGAGHAAVEEAPGEVNRELVPFLAM